MEPTATAAGTTAPPTPGRGGTAAPSPPGPQARRGRGRPRNPPPLTEHPIGADGAAPPPQAEPQKRRRRNAAPDVEGLKRNLIGIHKMLALVVPIQIEKVRDGHKVIVPLLELEDVEAQTLANGIAAVAREYDLDLDGKSGAAIQLLGAVALVYGPRVMTLQAFRKMQKAKQPTTVDATATEVPLNGTTAEH